MEINGIKVTINTPENVSEYVKQEKINYLYDILKPQKKPQ